jgi:hypothetical protein
MTMIIINQSTIYIFLYYDMIHNIVLCNGKIEYIIHKHNTYELLNSTLLRPPSSSMLVLVPYLILYTCFAILFLT